MFRGIQKTSLIDYPPYISSTLFTGGCNFRCPWCHNWDLVLPELYEKLPVIKEDEVKDYLVSKKGKIQGVCVTGGEPTLWGERLAGFFDWCRKNGFLTKLDTNGYLPDVLKGYIDRNLLDFIAMDIKNTFPKYKKTTGMTELDIKRIKKSIKIIQDSGVRHQFRTTLVPGLVEENEIKIIEEDLEEEILFQEYRNDKNS